VLPTLQGGWVPQDGSRQRTGPRRQGECVDWQALQGLTRGVALHQEDLRLGAVRGRAVRQLPRQRGLLQHALPPHQLPRLLRRLCRPERLLCAAAARSQYLATGGMAARADVSWRKCRLFSVRVFCSTTCASMAVSRVCCGLQQLWCSACSGHTAPAGLCPGCRPVPSHPSPMPRPHPALQFVML
jgi:hypothetical protein